MDTEVSKNSGEQKPSTSPMTELAKEPSFEDVQKDRAVVSEIKKIEDRNMRELLTACLPLFYRNSNPSYQEPVEYRHEILDDMLKYSNSKEHVIVPLSKYLSGLAEKFVKSGDAKRAHIYSDLIDDDVDEYTLPHGYVAQMEVGCDIDKNKREHNWRHSYSLSHYKCYEMYGDRLKQGEEIIHELQSSE